MSGTDNFAPFRKQFNRFVVKNISTDRNKEIRIFGYPIPNGQTRDILAIPNVAEGDIRASLIKGTLNHKIRAGEIIVIDSDIDLLQFNDDQKQFLIDAGVIKGLTASGSSIELPYVWKEDISLIGLKNDANNIFYTPDKFLNGLFPSGDQFHISVNHNGREIYENIDYTIGESGGAGTGYDTIFLISFIPSAGSILFASYAVNNI